MDDAAGTTFLASEDQGWTDLMEAIEAVPEERRGEEGAVPGWSPQDVVWHVAYWVGRAADVLELAGQGPPYPDEPDDPAYYDAENAVVRTEGLAMTWDEILEYLASGRGRARREIERCLERDREWIHERYAEEVEHYREHAGQLRAFVQAG